MDWNRCRQAILDLTIEGRAFAVAVDLSWSLETRGYQPPERVGFTEEGCIFIHWKSGLRYTCDHNGDIWQGVETYQIVYQVPVASACASLPTGFPRRAPTTAGESCASTPTMCLQCVPFRLWR